MMAGKSEIEWTQHTWNPIAGCSVKSTGCKHCYAMPMAARLEAMGQELYKGLTTPSNAGPVFNGTVRQAGDHVLLAPLKRKQSTTYFVNSMSDLFHENVPDEWIDRIFAVMALCPQHTFQVLTKRAERMRGYCSEATRRNTIELAAERVKPSKGYPVSPKWCFDWPLRNVWLGVSAERQQEADERIPLLLQTPAAVRFISAEPLLGAIDLTSIAWGKDHVRFPESDDISDAFSALHIINGTKLDWVIAGAESGPGARDCDVAWVRTLKNQCVLAGIPFFYKQHAIKGKKITTPELDGRRWVEMPGTRI